VTRDEHDVVEFEKEARRKPSFFHLLIHQDVRNPVSREKKRAIEIADAIRARLGKPEIKIGVFVDRKTWRAKVYSDSADAADLQRRVDRIVPDLQMLYDLGE
jgi:hypothetical protein